MKAYLHILRIVASSILINQYANALSIGKHKIHKRRPFVRKHATPLPLPFDSEDKKSSWPNLTSSIKRTHRKKRKSGWYRRRDRRDFQLNYKDTEDDISDVQEQEKSVRRVLSNIRLRSLRRRRSASIAVVQEESFVVDELVLGNTVDNEGPLEPPLLLEIDPSLVKPKKSSRRKKPKAIVTNVHELREAILDRGFELRDIELNYSPPPSLRSSNTTTFQHFNEHYSSTDPSNDTSNNIFTHDVLNLLHRRYHSQSTPANRAVDDNATLALAIEGGGMRGAVSGGMAAAIVCLGLSNAFDSIYGSSAGSIIGSYFVSRQLYLDVYTDVIPAEFDLFVSKAKIIGDIFRNIFLVMKSGSWKRLNSLLLERYKIPREEEVVTRQPTREGGLNISFVLDNIMCPDGGLRPLDLDSFAHNDEVQPLRIVSSAVELETGMMKSIVFSSKEGHFCDSFATLNGGIKNSTSLYPEITSAKADGEGYRRGLWACLGASMSVPGAAGTPFAMDLPSSNGTGTSPHLTFDAFCYEPVPYRSAVAEGATHVLALRSKPAGPPKTKPTLYERAVAPLYFRSNKAETVAQFFEKGGQQYLYAEDVLICDQGYEAKGAISIPPATVLYGSPENKNDAIKDRSCWAKAHLLPVTVPADIAEVGTLEDDREAIILGIRSGFAAAYDLLAPVVGLGVNPEMNGTRVAELVFPSSIDAPMDDVVFHLLPGIKLNKENKENARPETTGSKLNRREKIHRWLLMQKKVLTNLRNEIGSDKHHEEESRSSTPKEMNDTNDPSIIMSYLPAIEDGSIPLVTERLQTYINKQDNS